MTIQNDDFESDSNASGPEEGADRARRGRSRRHLRGDGRGEGRGDGRRRRRARKEGGRKEKVLHTRISEQLSEDIRQFAEDLRVPASNLVRNVLEEVFTVVDSVSDDMGDLMDDVIEEAEGVRDRVRRQAGARRRSPGATGRRRASSRDRDQDVEEELRRDEYAEAARSDRHSRDAFGGSDQAAAEDAPPSDPPRPSAGELFPDVLGWQPLVLNRDTQCGRCELALRAGESAFLGMTSGGLSSTALCGPCASGSRD